MRIVFLGTSGGIPTPRRSLPSVCVVRDGEMMLFDCGEGTQMRIIRGGLGFGRLSKIFISHIHGDHLSGLPGLIMTLNLLGHATPLTIWGPTELPPFIQSLERDIKLRCRFPLDIKPIHGGVFVKEKDYHIEAVPLEHSAPCWGFALQEKPRPGRFNLEGARELGIPEGPLFGLLQKGESITLDDGRVITPPDVLGLARPGRRLVYITDTVYKPGLASFCRGADLLIHEGMFTSDMLADALERKHCTAAQAATLARDAGARRLVLTHISARYADTSVLEEEARAVFPGAVIARDMYELEVPYVEEEIG
jgi:ribonuclease Z